MSPFALSRPGQRPEPGDFSPVTLSALADGLIDPSSDTHRCLANVVESLRPQIRAKRLHVSMQFLARDYRLVRTPERLRQTFASLLRSAMGSAPAGGQITIRSTCPGEGVLRVEVMEHRRRRKHLVH